MPSASAPGHAPRVNRSLATLTLAALALLPVGGISGAQEVDPLLSVADADPLELSRVVARMGDTEVLAALGGTSAARALLAIQSCPYLAESEASLPVLGALARGRDPDLAPAAALAASRVVEGLTASELTAREVSAEDLRTAAELFEAIASEEGARPDIRQGALLVVAGLAAFAGE